MAETSLPQHAPGSFRSVVADLIQRWGLTSFWIDPENVAIAAKALFFTYGLIPSPSENDTIMLESTLRELFRRQELVWLAPVEVRERWTAAHTPVQEVDRG